MTNTERIQANNAELREAIEMAENLPGAGGGDDVARSIVNKTITAYSDNEITTVGAYAFNGCNKMTSVNLQNATSVDQYAFNGCSALTYVDLPICKKIIEKGFNKCSSLETLILRKSDAVCTLANVSAFTGTPIASGTGYIYVPKALLESYKVATNWSTFAAQFRAIEDYPEICGG